MSTRTPFENLTGINPGVTIEEKLDDTVSEAIELVPETSGEESLEEILEFYQDEDTLRYFVDPRFAEQSLRRLESLLADSETQPFGEQRERAERLIGAFRIRLALYEGATSSHLNFMSFDELQGSLREKYGQELSVEDYVEQMASPSPLSFSGEALLGAEIKEREWLLEPLLKRESTAMLYADTGLGKTWFSWALIAAIGGGGEFAGWKADKPRRVLVLDGEMHFAELRERFEGVLRSHPADVQKRAVDNISVIPRQAQHWSTEFYDLDKKEYQDGLLDRLDTARKDGKPIELLVLDNFSCLANIEDENSSSAFNGICEFINKAKTMTSVLLVHHSGKNPSQKQGSSYRGSSKLGGIMEVCLSLKKPGAKDLPEHRGAAFTVELEKYRGLRDETTDLRVFSLDPESMEWSYKASDEQEENRCVEALRTGDFTTMQQIAEALGVNKSTVSRNIQKAIADGKLTEKQKNLYLSVTTADAEPEGEGEPDF